MIDTISQTLVRKNLADCTVNELRELAQQYPYFSPLHVLLSAKLKADNDRTTKAEYQKTSLYFNNIMWLDYLLSGPATVVKSHTTERKDFEDVHTLESEPTSNDEYAAVEEDAFTSNEIHNQSPHADNNRGDIIIESPENSLETNLPQDSPVADDAAIQIEKAESGKESHTPEINEPDQAELKIPEIKISTVDPSVVPLTFEPYHTVDYFASQGIKMREENKPTDRFSQQLKSFTEWLKTMKKIPAVEIAKASDSAGEQKVEQMAATSITDREVVTEAMAEVWEKQGEKDKAREIYRKLSLLDPSKSAYFAAKIESLK